MPEDDEITEKRRLNLKPQASRRKTRPLPRPESPHLTPMPALEELKRSERDEWADQPTMPLVFRQESAPDDISRHPTVPLAQGVSGLFQATRRRAQKHLSQRLKSARGRRLAPPSLRHLKRERSPFRVKMLIILLVLLLLGGLVTSGLCALENAIITPLAQFFHPLSDDMTGPIDGRAWNLLLMGSDNDQKFAFPAVLTQVMMVARIDPLKQRITLLSLPRDSWVAVPGQAGMHKIDQAFRLGTAKSNHFDDGVRLARQTVEQDYGIPIDRYAWVGLEGFASVIDALGGVDIDVTHPLSDDAYPDDTGKNNTHATSPYAVRRLYLAPGPQHLDGEQALAYVRSRHADLVGDIGRTRRQQDVLEALKNKLNVTSVFDHLSALIHSLKGNVYTNLSESELLANATFARGLPDSAIQRITLGPGKGSQNYGSLANVKNPGPDGSQQIILPNCANIQPLVNRLFDLGNAQSCQVQASGS